MSTVYTALSAVNTKFTFYNTLLQWSMNIFGLALVVPFSIVHALIFKCCTVEFLTCTQHSENHADPLVQSGWQFQTVRQELRLPCGGTQGGHSIVTIHLVMIWPIHRHQRFGVWKAFHKKPNWHTLFISCPIHNVATIKVKPVNNASDYKCRD